MNYRQTDRHKKHTDRKKLREGKNSQTKRQTDRNDRVTQKTYIRK